MKKQELTRCKDVLQYERDANESNVKFFKFYKEDTKKKKLK